MQITINVPDELLAAAGDRMLPVESGILHTIALDAILQFLSSLAADGQDADGD